jgi:hypothetical protein
LLIIVERDESDKRIIQSYMYIKTEMIPCLQAGTWKEVGALNSNEDSGLK